VDAQSVATAVLAELARRGEIKREAPKLAVEKYQLLDVRAAGAGPTGGEA
jgi:pyruvate dehydrogenase E1 component